MPQRKLMSEFREKEKEIWEPEQVVKEDKNPPWKSCSSYTAQEVDRAVAAYSQPPMRREKYLSQFCSQSELWFDNISGLFHNLHWDINLYWWVLFCGSFNLILLLFSSKTDYYLACVKCDLSFICKVCSSVSRPRM